MAGHLANTTKRATTLQSHPQGRGILENLDLMPAFANRARRRAIVLRKHPSGKFHLIITGNCGIRLKSRTQNNNGLLREGYFAGDCRSHTVGLSRLTSHLPFLRGPYTSLRSSELVSIPGSWGPEEHPILLFKLIHALPPPSDSQWPESHGRLVAEVWWQQELVNEYETTQGNK